VYDRTSAGETLFSLHKALELHTVTDTVQVEAIEQAIADVERRYPISEFKFRGGAEFVAGNRRICQRLGNHSDLSKAIRLGFTMAKVRKSSITPRDSFVVAL
jgi:hypothetical protein